MNAWNEKARGRGRTNYQLTNKLMKTAHNECFAYTRVSTAKQGEGVSLEAQKEAIQAFADRNDLIITRWFEERETAAKSGRPVFDAMMKLLHQRKASGIIIHKIDRSARNFSDWAKIGDLSDAGIDVHFANESLDFRSRGGRLTADIQAVIAADYVRNLRQETIKGIDGRLKQGLYPFKAPVGYLDNGGGKVKTPDPVRAPLVISVLEQYASGEHSIRSLIEYARQIGLTSSNGKPLNKTGIERILRNPFYMGIIHINSTGLAYPGIHKPLVSAKLYEQIEKVKLLRHVKKKSKHNFTYRGLFHCGLCKRGMIPERQRGLIYYRCQFQECPTKTIRENIIDQLVVEHLKRLEMHTPSLQEFCDVLKKSIAPGNGKEQRRLLVLQKSKNEARLDALTDKFLDNLFDQETYNKKRLAFLSRAQELREKIIETENIEAQKCNIEKFLEHVKNVANTYDFANPSEKRQIVKLAFSNRCVIARKLILEPRNWLFKPAICDAVPYCGDSDPKNRSRYEVQDDVYDGVFNIDDFRQMVELTNVLKDIKQRQK